MLHRLFEQLGVGQVLVEKLKRPRKDVSGADALVDGEAQLHRAHRLLKPVPAVNGGEFALAHRQEHADGAGVVYVVEDAVHSEGRHIRQIGGGVEGGEVDYGFEQHPAPVKPEYRAYQPGEDEVRQVEEEFEQLIRAGGRLRRGGGGLLRVAVDFATFSVTVETLSPSS